MPPFFFLADFFQNKRLGSLSLQYFDFNSTSNFSFSCQERNSGRKYCLIDKFFVCDNENECFLLIKRVRFFGLIGSNSVKKYFNIQTNNFMFKSSLHLSKVCEKTYLFLLRLKKKKKREREILF